MRQDLEQEATMRNRSLLGPILGIVIMSLLGTLPIAIGKPKSAVAQQNPVCVPSDVPLFEDVVPGDYGSEYIRCARALGLTVGTAEGTFEPQEHLTRAQMASFLVRLWRDIDGNDCQTVQHPFTDVAAGSTHEANIACLYALGATKGVTPQRYDPRGTLKTSQMTRFVVRMLNLLSPRTCNTSSIELTQAASCLASLNIAPSVEEARSSAAVSRAQMAVYLIGLWLHAVAGERPPTPPVRPIWRIDQEYQMVAIGFDHSCWLRITGTVECLSRITGDSIIAPDITFTSVTAGYDFSCGIRPQGSIVCWGDDSAGKLDAATGAFVTIASGLRHTCGVLVEGSLACWGASEAGQTQAPEGDFSTVAAGFAHSCGLALGGRVRCWGDNSYGQNDVPSGRFIDVATGQAHSCGLRTSGVIECWGRNRHGQTDAPRGRFTDVVGGLAHTCGLSVDATIRCWGNNELGQTDAPEGRFTHIWAGLVGSCAMDPQGAITCWGGRVLNADSP